MIGGPRLSILMNFEPVMSITIAALLLGEVLAPIQYVGGVPRAWSDLRRGLVRQALIFKANFVTFQFVMGSLGLVLD